MPKLGPPTTPLLAFLGGEGTDGAGRTLAEVLAFDDAAIERHHDFIQWLFPLPTRSMASSDAPILTTEEIAAIRRNPSLQDAIRQALARMSAFYAATGHWLAGHDHNHLRITRIIRSVGLLLGPSEAERFYDAIRDRDAGAGRPVSPRNRRYWEDALAAAWRREPMP